MVQARLIETIEVAHTHGEGVLWRESDQTVWWTDIHGRRIHRLAWPSLKLATFATPQRACALAFVEGRDDILLVAFESGFGLFAPESGAIAWLARPAALGLRMRLNDGRVGPGGRFWSGGKDEGGGGPDQMPAGVLYRLGADGQADAVLGGLKIANGLAWTADGRRMFVADSALGQVFAAPFDPLSGVPGRFERFASFTGEYPDGAVTDADGNYWTALWSGGRVACLSPDGQEIGSVAVDARQPSCPAFGGESGNLLFVTSARDELDDAALAASPRAGSLFVYETDARGAPVTRARLESRLIGQIEP